MKFFKITSVAEAAKFLTKNKNAHPFVHFQFSESSANIDSFRSDFGDPYLPSNIKWQYPISFLDALQSNKSIKYLKLNIEYPNCEYMSTWRHNYWDRKCHEKLPAVVYDYNAYQDFRALQKILTEHSTIKHVKGTFAITNHVVCAYHRVSRKMDTKEIDIFKKNSGLFGLSDQRRLENFEEEKPVDKKEETFSSNVFRKK